MARDNSLIPPNFRLERLRPYEPGEAPPLRAIQAPTVEADEEEAEVEVEEEAGETAAVAGDAVAEAEHEGEEDRARRRRRRRRRRPDEPRGKPARPRRRPASRRPTAEPAERPGKLADEEKEGEAEAERRRRRRGRRGGRTRSRREEAAEVAASEAPVAAEIIEIVSAPADAVEEERIEAAMTEAPTPWPEVSGIEAASLAPLAGEGTEPAPMFDERKADETAAAPTAAEPAATGDAEQAIPFTEEGIPFTSEAERVLEETAAEAVPLRYEEPISEPPPRPGEELRTVTEKPANPRRGWWQRLIQP